MKIEIRNRWNSEIILFQGEFPSLKDAVVYAVAHQISLRGANLSDAYLSGANLSGADLSNANLSGADLSNANLSGADLRGAYLSGADLRGAYLSGADLSNANLSGADLRGVYLSGADLRGVYLSNANLSGVYLSGAYLSDWGTLIGNSPIFIQGPLGSRKDYLTSFLTDKGIIVQTGCYVNTLEKFIDQVQNVHGDNTCSKEYAAAVEMLKTYHSIHTPTLNKSPIKG